MMAIRYTSALVLRNGRNRPPTIVGVAYNHDRLAEKQDVQAVESFEAFEEFLRQRPRIPTDRIALILKHFEPHFET